MTLISIDNSNSVLSLNCGVWDRFVTVALIPPCFLVFATLVFYIIIFCVDRFGILDIPICSQHFFIAMLLPDMRDDAMLRMRHEQWRRKFWKLVLCMTPFSSLRFVVVVV